MAVAWTRGSEVGKRVQEQVGRVLKVVPDTTEFIEEA